MLVRPQLSQTVSVLLGVLLLTAAGLKLYGLNVAPFAQYGTLTTPWLQMAAVEWEILLGLWLLSGAYRIGAWLAALGTFLTFATISGYLGWVGQASCGCFGVVKASPWAAFSVDVIALILLILTRPGRRAVWQTSRADLFHVPTGVSGTLLGANLILILLTATAMGIYGSPAAVLARIQGVPLYTPGYVDFGTGQPGAIMERKVTVTNCADEPIRLIGGTSDCSCITTTNMPLTIPPGETASVPIRLHVPGSATGVFTRRAELWSSADQRRVVPITIGCQIK